VKQVLVIDDEASVARLVAAALRAADLKHRLDYCSDGGQGRTMAARGQHDLIVLDLAMPLMDGFDALEEMKRNPKSSEIPIIVLTALHDAELHKRARELGAIEVITKPCGLWELVSAFRLILAGKEIKPPQGADSDPARPAGE
jgi:DNA-binding response OmpR family regulator